jgi:hypothetical protein
VRKYAGVHVGTWSNGLAAAAAVQLVQEVTHKLTCGCLKLGMPRIARLAASCCVLLTQAMQPVMLAPAPHDSQARADMPAHAGGMKNTPDTQPGDAHRKRTGVEHSSVQNSIQLGLAEQ